MRKRIIIAALAAVMALAGCGSYDGEENTEKASVCNAHMTRVNAAQSAEKTVLDVEKDLGGENNAEVQSEAMLMTQECGETSQEDDIEALNCEIDNAVSDLNTVEYIVSGQAVRDSEELYGKDLEPCSDKGAGRYYLLKGYNADPLEMVIGGGRLSCEFCRERGYLGSDAPIVENGGEYYFRADHMKDGRDLYQRADDDVSFIDRNTCRVNAVRRENIVDGVLACSEYGKDCVITLKRKKVINVGKVLWQIDSIEFV